MARAEIDTTNAAGYRFVGVRTDTLVFTLVDNEGVVTGNLRYSYRMRIVRTPDTPRPDTLNVSTSVSERDVTGLYAPPFLDLDSGGAYDHLDFEVAGDEALGRVDLGISMPGHTSVPGATFATEVLAPVTFLRLNGQE